MPVDDGPGSPRPRADAVRNRERIVVAAAEVLAGDPGAGMDDVVRAAGLARATVYRYFPTREALVQVVVDRALGVVANLLAAARPDDGDAISALVRLTAAGWSAGAANRALVVLVAGGQGSGTVGEPAARVEQLVHRVLRRGQDEGALRDDVPTSWLVDQWFAALQSALVHAPDTDGDPVVLVTSLFLGGAAAGS